MGSSERSKILRLLVHNKTGYIYEKHFLWVWGMARFILTRVALHLTILMEYFIEYIWDEKIELYWYLKLEVFLVKSIFQRWRCWPELFNSILWKIYMWNFLWFTVKYVILWPRFFIWIFLKLYKWKGWCITLLNIVNINFIW